MDWTGCWPLSERPLPTCASGIHFPFLASSGGTSSRVIYDSESKRSPPKSPHDRDNVKVGNEWHADQSTPSNVWDPKILAGQTNYETQKEFSDPPGRTPPAGYRGHESPTSSMTTDSFTQVDDYPAKKRPKKSAFRKIRRVHFSVELQGNREGSIDDTISAGTSNVSEGYESGCMPNYRKLDIELFNSGTSKFGACSSFPMPPPLGQRSCGPWNYDFDRPQAQSTSGDREHSLEVQKEPCTCNTPSMRPNTNFPEPREKALEKAVQIPTANQESKPHDGLGDPSASSSRYPPFFKIEKQEETLHDDTKSKVERPQSPAINTCLSTGIDFLGLRKCSEISKQPSDPNLPDMEHNNYLSPTDDGAPTSLRNCATLLGPLEPNKQLTLNVEKPGYPLQQLRISGVHAIDQNKPQTKVDDRVANGTNRYNNARALRKPFPKFRKGGNKTPKSSYWFVVPYSSDADLPDGLLERLQRKAPATPPSKPVVNVGNKIVKRSAPDADNPGAGLSCQKSLANPDSEPVVDVHRNSSRSLDWFDFPHSEDGDHQPAGLSQGGSGVSTTPLEPVVNVVGKSSKPLYWFEDHYSAEAGVPPAGLLQERVATPDSEPAVDVESEDAIKPSKRMCWFDGPYLADANLLIGSSQKPVETPDSELGKIDAARKPLPKSSCCYELPSYATDATPSPFSEAKDFATPDSEPAVLDVGNKPSKDLPLNSTSSEESARLLPDKVETPVSEPGLDIPQLKNTKGSYWFDVPFSTETCLQAARSSQRAKTTDSKPLTKSSYWFDVPYSTEDDLPAGLLQRLRHSTPDSEPVDEAVCTTDSLGLGRHGVELMINNNFGSPQPLDYAQHEVRYGAVTRKSPSTGKVYPGVFCPTFTLCPGDIMMTRNLRTEHSLSKIGGHVTLVPDHRFFEEKGITAASSSEHYRFTQFDMVIRFGQFHDDWNWIPSPSFNLFMYAPPGKSSQSAATASWWLVDTKPSVALPAPDQHLDREVPSMPLNSRLQLALRHTDLVISTILEPGLACKKRWTSRWGNSPLLPLTQDVLVRACYGHDWSYQHHPITKTTLATVELYSYCGDSMASWRFLGRDSFCYGKMCSAR
ncbi:unnamed protein product [Calypogeia fissa]